MTLIDYKNVEICQQEQVVLRDVNLTINSGEYVYLLGKVGSGKSTLMKTFYAEIPVIANKRSRADKESDDSPKALMLNYDLTRIRRKQVPYLRRKIGIVFQDFQLLTDRTVEDNLLFVLRATGWKDKAVMRTHIHEVLSQVGMENKSYKMPHQLSGGEQQRVVIARALLNSPEIILADEPTGNLDPETGEEIMELLYSIRTSGTTIIMSTHNMNWVEKYQGRCLWFKDGKITEHA